MVLSILINAVMNCFGKKSRRQALTDLVESRLTTITEKGWLHGVIAEHGNPIALKPVKITRGLSGYPPLGFVDSIFGKGTLADLVVTERSLLFCIPSLAEKSTILPVCRTRIRSASTGLLAGPTIVIETDDGAITCETEGDLDAAPIAAVIRGG